MEGAPPQQREPHRWGNSVSRTGDFQVSVITWDELRVFASAYSGIRMGEMFALCADDVNTSNCTIRIRRQVQSIRGKGKIMDLPKGRKTRTTIYPVPSTHEALPGRAPAG